MAISGKRITKDLFVEELQQEFDAKITAAEVPPVDWENVLNKPQLADSSWRSPVATPLDLPQAGNAPEDVRLTLSTNEVYSWDGSAWVLIGANDVNVEWSHLQNKPATFPPETHTHPKSAITDFAHSHLVEDLSDWPSSFPPENHTHITANLTDWPLTFPPESHLHTVADISDLSVYNQSEIDAMLSGKSDTTHTHSYTALTDLPDIYTKTEVDTALSGKAALAHDHDGRYYTQAQVTGYLSGKVDTVVGKALSTNDFTDLLKSKLDAIEAGANAYVHPAAHVATMITEDASHRFVTDTEKGVWNGKSDLALGETLTTAYRGDRGKTAYDHSQSAHAPANAQKNSDITKAEIEAKLTGTITSHTHSGSAPAAHAVNHISGDDVLPNAVAGGASGLMTGSDKTKLDGLSNYTHPATHPPSIITQDAGNRFFTDAERTKLSGIEAGANAYSHPATHPPGIITQDASNRFVTDAEKSAWNAKQDALSGNTVTSHYHDGRYISKVNTDAFTPTLSYHPATKKYVDDAVKLPYSSGTSAPADTSIFWVDTN